MCCSSCVHRRLALSTGPVSFSCMPCPLQDENQALCSNHVNLALTPTICDVMLVSRGGATGVGIQFEKANPGPFKIKSLTEGGSAALSGKIKAGDLLHGVNDNSGSWMTLPAMLVLTVFWIHGPFLFLTPSLGCTDSVRA